MVRSFVPDVTEIPRGFQIQFHFLWLSRISWIWSYAPNELSTIDDSSGKRKKKKNDDVRDFWRRWQRYGSFHILYERQTIFELEFSIVGTLQIVYSIGAVAIDKEMTQSRLENGITEQ